MPCSVAEFATAEQLRAFNTDDTDGSDSAAKVYLGENNQQWWIAGSQSEDSLVLFSASSLGNAAFQESSQEQEYEGQTVYANHYGASQIRTMLPELAQSLFNASENSLLKRSVLYTEDTKNGTVYALEDRLYLGCAATEAKVNAAEELYDALTEHEKSLVSDAARDKLENLLAALVDYQVVKGDGSKWEKGTDTGLLFTANGAYSKFAGISVDGNAVDRESYTAVFGSTSITLKPEYLETLPAGAHTLTVRYTDGETSCAFTVAEKPAGAVNTSVQSAQTGDDSDLAVWAVAMLAAGAALTGIILYSRNRRSDLTGRE